MKKTVSYLVIFAIILFFCLLLYNTLSRNKSDFSKIDTLTITITQKDTIHISDTLIITETDTINNIVFHSFNYEDSNIYIRGSIECLSNKTNISYYIKPITLDVVALTPDSVEIIVNENYNIDVSGGLSIQRVYRSGFFASAGVGWNKNQYSPVLNTGYNFGKIGISAGITKDILTGSLIYYF